MRYVLNFNRAAAKTLDPTKYRLEVKRSNKGHSFLEGARVLVRATDEDDNTVAFSPKEQNFENCRFTSVMSQKAAREAGIKARERYRLVRHGNSSWHWLVPTSKVRNSKPVRSTEPTVSVSLVG